MSRAIRCIVAAGILLLPAGLPTQTDAQEKEPEVGAVYPSAVFPFAERGSGVRDYGAKVGDLLFAKLVVNPEMYLVDRTDMKKILDELELNASGAVKPGAAAKVGQMSGAKILVSGSVLQVGKKIYLVARIVGTETSRTMGASVNGPMTDELDGLVEKLAEKISETITKHSNKLVAKAMKSKDRIAALKKKIAAKKLPAVMINIPERHIGGAGVDPAAQTEIARFCTELGFNVVDADTGAVGQADILIKGEGLSEFASRRGNLIAVKARVELKAIDRKTGKVLTSDRQTALAVDLTENIASKSALQNAAATLAERILPKLVKKK